MNRKTKDALRKRIGQSIDLSGVRLKDDEAEYLVGICERGVELDGLSKSESRRHVGWCSEGKYVRDECSMYTVISDDEGLRIEEHYECRDDDGYSDACDVTHAGVRDVMRLLTNVFGL